MLLLEPFFEQHHLVAFLFVSTWNITLVDDAVVSVSKPVDAACVDPEHRYVGRLDMYLMGKLDSNLRFTINGIS